MSDKIPPEVQKLIDSGYGRVVIQNENENGVRMGLYHLSLSEMEAMGPEERQRLGLERFYQFALQKNAELGINTDDEA
jgi:hypothetical protein